MAIRMFAECDDTNCPEKEPTSGAGRYPDGWLVVEVHRSRFLGALPTGTYGFHSRDCFLVWASQKRGSSHG